MGSITGSRTKARITGGTPAAVLVSVLFALIGGCDPGSDRDRPPSLYIEPSSALQGASLYVNVGADGVDFSKCDNLDATAFSFKNESGQSQIDVFSPTIVGENVISLSLWVDHEASEGTHSMAFQCDSNTLLEGTFTVRDLEGEAALTMEPDNAPAGTYGQVVDITVQGSTFVEGVSHVVFGDGTDVAIKSEQIVGSTNQMQVTIDVSALAPVGEMDVAVVTGSSVARGTFLVTERTYPTVQVTPDEVDRPVLDDFTLHSLVVSGQNIVLDATSDVSFPDNPGLVVEAVDPSGGNKLDVNIQVHNNALLGPTPLLVESGGLEATTDFTVLPDQSQPAMLLYPPQLERGGETVLIAQVANFSLDGSTTADFSVPGCDIDHYSVLSSDSMVLWVTVDSAFSQDQVLLTLTDGSDQVFSTVPVVDLTSPSVSLDTSFGSPSCLDQGDTDTFWLKIENGTFVSSAKAQVPVRSGLRIANNPVYLSPEHLSVVLQAAEDAPVGPSMITVSSGSELYSVGICINPASGQPFVGMQPQVVVPGHRTVSLAMSAYGQTYASDASVQLDDPSVEVQDFDLMDGGVAEVSLEVMPTAREDIVVAYLNSGGAKRAASYRALPRNVFVATAVNPNILRGSEETNRLVQVEIPDYSFGDSVVAQVFDGIGVQVERVTVIDEDTVELELKVAPTGPGGWFGAVLTEGGVQAVVPLNLNHGTDTLTMQLTHPPVEPGSRATLINATLPASASLNSVLSTAGACTEDAYAALDSVTLPNQATVVLDVVYDAPVPPEDIPIYVTGAKGAAVGFVSPTSIQVGSANHAAPFDQTLAAGETALVDVDPGHLPTVLVPSSQRANYTDCHAAVLADGALVAQDQTKGEFMWLLSNQDSLVAVSPVGTTTDPVRLDVVPRGSGIVEVAEPNDDLVDAFSLVDDPCDTPFWGTGEISVGTVDGFDADTLEIPPSSCELAAVVLARGIADHPWRTPDIATELQAATGATLDWSDDWSPANLDPVIYFSGDVANRFLRLSAMLGTTGTYLLNIRRSTVISEVCLGANDKFVELYLKPGDDLGGFSLAYFDSAGMPGPVLSLSGTVPADGVLVVGDSVDGPVDFDTSWLASVSSGADFSVQLMEGAMAVDAVQVGGGGNHGEGSPVPNNGQTCVARTAGVDTNDNLFDYIGGWYPTRGE